MDALIEEIESIVRFAGDKLEILRARSPHRPYAMNLADELEPPAREEVAGLFRPAGVPRPIATGAWLGAMAVVILVGGGVARWRWPSPSSDRAPTTAVLTPPAPPVTSVAPAVVATASTGRREAPISQFGGAAGGVRADPTANPRTKQERPSRTPSRADTPRGRGGAASGSSPPAFGTGDIVNPWAK